MSADDYIDVTPRPKPTPKEKAPRRWMKRSRLKPVSDKKLEQIEDEDRVNVRAAVFERDAVAARKEGRSTPCRIAPFLPDNPCFGPMTVHHLWKEGQGGPYTLENLVTACSHHNSWIETEPRQAEALGLVKHGHWKGGG